MTRGRTSGPTSEDAVAESGDAAGKDTAGRSGLTAPAAPATPPRLGREFGKLWTASGTSAIGDGVSLTAAPLLASLLTDDARLIAGVTMALTLPFALFGIPAGVLVDRFDRRRSMVYVDLFRGCVVGLFALSVLLGHGNLIALYVCFFLVGTCETYFRNASQALVPAVVPRPLLIEANGRLLGTQVAASQFIGPLLGSVIFGVATVLPFGLDALTFLVSAVLLMRLRSSPERSYRQDRPATDQLNLLADMTTGARWLLRHRVLRSLAAMAGLINLVSAGGMAVLVVYAQHVLKLGSFGFGLLLSCQAVGAIVASRVSPLLVRRVGRDWALVFVALALMVKSIVLWQVPVIWVAGTALLLGACAEVTWDVVVVALRQTVIPGHLQGRVNSVYRLVAWGCMPVGAGAAGLLAHSLGTPAVFGVGAVVMAGVAAVLARGARRHWISATDTPSPDDKEP